MITIEREKKKVAIQRERRRGHMDGNVKEESHSSKNEGSRNKGPEKVVKPIMRVR
jgi:hypothetical protein